MLIINNLAASMMWHRLSVLDPSKALLQRLQKMFVDFFWDGYHWLPPAYLYLPVKEGGQGLIDLVAKVKSLRLKTVQTLLYPVVFRPWVSFGLALLRTFGCFGLDRQLFLMSTLSGNFSPDVMFYNSVLNSWSIFKLGRDESNHFGLEEPLFYNSLLDYNINSFNALVKSFMEKGMTKLSDLVDNSSKAWRSVVDICSQAGFKSVRTIERFVGGLKAALPSTLLLFINCFLLGGPSRVSFPKLFVSPDVCFHNDQEGKLLFFNRLQELNFQVAGKRDLYHICVKAVYFEQIKDRSDTKWREFLTVPAELSPSWRILYKGPLPKRSGDLQWRLLHCTLPTNSHVSKFNLNVSPSCYFCSSSESVFHAFTECFRLAPMFTLLERLIGGLGFVFSKTLFVFGCKYSRVHSQRCTLANFIMGQAKLAIWKSCRLAAEGQNINVLRYFTALMEFRIRVEYRFSQMTDNLHDFEFKWCVNDVLLSLCEDGEIIFNW